MSAPARGETGYFLLRAARAPHLGKVGLALLVLIIGSVIAAERTGRIGFVTAGFLAFAGLTATLFLLCLYDLSVSLLRIRYRPADPSALPEPFRIASDVAREYVRWLAPLGFVVGIIFGHYFWQ
jgi:hypothetical protein